MKTLIELYDERAIENILAPDMFRPERIVYLCPAELSQDRKRQEKMRSFFLRRGWDPELLFMESSLFKADRILRQLQAIYEKYPDCAVDVTGGSDAALFAAGMFSCKTGTPAFTYSRKQNRFYDISGAAFADNVTCTRSYSVEEFFLMAGGTLLPGRVDNTILSKYLSDFDPFFECFLRFRRDWTDIISYIQRVSPSEYGQEPSLYIQGKYTVKGDHGSRNTVNEDALRELARIGFIKDLKIVRGESVSFRFRDSNVRTWLRDVGSVLELTPTRHVLTPVSSMTLSAAPLCAGMKFWGMAAFPTKSMLWLHGESFPCLSAVRPATSKQKHSMSLQSFGTALAEKVQKRPLLQLSPVMQLLGTAPPSWGLPSLIWKN